MHRTKILLILTCCIAAPAGAQPAAGSFEFRIQDKDGVFVKLRELGTLRALKLVDQCPGCESSDIGGRTTGAPTQPSHPVPTFDPKLMASMKLACEAQGKRWLPLGATCVSK